MQAPERLLIVDDEATVAHVLSQVLRQDRHEVTTAGSAEAALACLGGPPFALAMLDIVLPGMSGLTLLERIKQHDGDTEVVVMTSHASAQTAIDALRLGAYDYLHKPFELDDVLALVRRALVKRSLTVQNRLLREEQARQNEELRVAVKRLRASNSAGIAMSGVGTLQELFEFIVDMVKDELDCERVSLMLVDGTGTALTIAASRGLSAEIVQDTRLPVGEGIAGRVAQQGRPFLSSVHAQDVGTIAGGHAGAVGEFLSIPISMSVPIRTPRDVLGVLNLTSRRSGREFADDDVAYIYAMASQAAAAIDRAMQAEGLRRAYDELRTTQDQLIASSRLKAFGEMAAGVAHDFNNVLNGILARSQLLQRGLAAQPASLDVMRNHADLIVNLARQGAETVRRIQEFGRVRVDRPSEQVKLSEVARLAIALTESKWQGEPSAHGHSIGVESSLGEVPPIAGNRQELVQAVSNLIFNAVEAMPTGGDMKLRTWCPGDDVRLQLSDTGCGMNAETRERLFEPFFTSKPNGQGLGMSVVYGIVSRLGGRIEVDSHEGGGTSVTLVFPVAKPCPEATAAQPGTSVAPETMKPARVLVVDDEEMNLAICREVLEPEGHHVRTTASGAEALRLIAEESFDLVITDLVMPGLSGWEVASGVKRSSPRTRVMLLSGWGVQRSEDEARAAGVDRMLPKPIGVEELLGSVRQLLAA